MKAQINIEFLAGSLLFIAALTFVVTQALGVIPQFQETVETNDVQVDAAAFTRFLLQQPGRWMNDTAAGSDWERHVPDTTMLGLATAPYTVNETKVARLVDDHAGDTVNYSEALTLLQVDTRTRGDATVHDIGFRIHNVTAYTPVSTRHTYDKSNPGDKPRKITEPDEQRFQDAADTVHYGRARIQGVFAHFLVADAENGGDPILYMKKRNWDFSGVTGQETENDEIRYTFNDVEYTAQTGDAGVARSNGNLVVLTRELLQSPPYGPEPPLSAGQTVRREAYANTVDDDIVKLVVSVWNTE